MIRTLTANYTPIVDCSRDDWKTLPETASGEMVLGAVWALCKVSLLVSQQIHYDLSLIALDDAHKRFHKQQGAFREQKM